MQQEASEIQSRPTEFAISAIIPCFNAASFLRNAVASIAKQGIERTEILIVDDVSTDDTVQIAEQLTREIPHLRVLRQAANGGPAKARNAGLRAARGNYVCFLDADDVYGDGVFSRALAFLNGAPWASAVDFGVRLVNCHREVQPLHLQLMTNSLPSNLVVRREAALAVGGFPEDAAFLTPRAGEDIAFRRALGEWGHIRRLSDACLEYTVRPKSHFDKFIDSVQVAKDNTVRTISDQDSETLAAGVRNHLSRVRSQMREAASIGKCAPLHYLVNDRKYVLEVFDNGVSAMHATNILNGKTYPRIPFLSGAARILDIGANVGASAVHFSLHYPSARVVALEPTRQSFVLLRCNTFDHQMIEPYNIGLLDVTTRRSIFVGLPDAVTNSIYQNALSSNRKEEIQLVSADAFVKQTGMERPDIIKIDTEGCEIPIIRSIIDSFRAAKAVYLEYHSETDRLQIDRILADTHILFSGNVPHPHRGELVYVRNDAFPSAQERDRWRIAS